MSSVRRTSAHRGACAVAMRGLTRSAHKEWLNGMLLVCSPAPSEAAVRGAVCQLRARKHAARLRRGHCGARGSSPPLPVLCVILQDVEDYHTVMPGATDSGYDIEMNDVIQNAMYYASALPTPSNY